MELHCFQFIFMKSLVRGSSVGNITRISYSLTDVFEKFRGGGYYFFAAIKDMRGNNCRGLDKLLKGWAHFKTLLPWISTNDYTKLETIQFDQTLNLSRSIIQSIDIFVIAGNWSIVTRVQRASRVWEIRP